MALPAFGGAAGRSEFRGRELRESGDSGATNGRTDGGEGNDDDDGNGEASVGFWPAAAQTACASRLLDPRVSRLPVMK